MAIEVVELSGWEIGMEIGMMIGMEIGTNGFVSTRGWSTSKIRHFLSKLLKSSVDHEHLTKRFNGQWMVKLSLQLHRIRSTLSANSDTQ